MTTNGVHPDLGSRPGALDLVKVRRIVVAAIGEEQRRLADARTVVERAGDVIRQLEDDLRRLRRVLAFLEEEAPAGAPPPAPAARPEGLPPIGRGTRLGGGVGRRAGTYLLEVARQRHAASDVATFTTAVARLACKGWPTRTVTEGLQRLIEDGLLRRTRVGHYELTSLGLAQPPAAAGELPLLAPRESEEASA